MITKILSIYLFLGILLLTYMFVISFSRGRSSYAKALGALSLSIQIYLLGYLMEVNMSQLDQLLFWNQIQYLGIPFFPGLWLLVSILYTGRGSQFKGIGWFLIFSVPIITFIARATNEWHGLYYTKIELITSNDITLMLLSKGPLYVFHMVYVLVTLLMCTWFYYQRYKMSTGLERMPFRLLLIASILPYVSLVLVALNMGGTGIDFTAIILPPCVLLINIALTRYNFMEIKTLARERVFVDSESGLVLLNKNYEVVDFNPASIAFFKWLGIDISSGQLEQILADHSALLEDIKEAKERVLYANYQEEMKFLNIKVHRIQSGTEINGFLVTLEDVTEREQLKERLIEMANTDGLSGLNNRRYFSECAHDIYTRAKRYNETFCVLMMDIDYFKKINDSYGHSVGDDVIRTFSNLLQSTFRSTDIIGRMGGEEFAVIMINVDHDTAFKKAEEFRTLVENHIMIFGNFQFKITVSIGMSEMTSTTPSFDTLVSQADHLLYKAKDAGRNRTMYMG